MPFKHPSHITTGTVNFMGQTMTALLFLTDSSRTIYAPECSAWFTHSASVDKRPAPATEVCGLRTFALLEKALGVIGLRGLDRLFAFRTVNEFNLFLKFYASEVHPFRTLLDQVRETLFPESKIIPNASKLYAGVVKKVSTCADGTLQDCIRIPLLSYSVLDVR